MTTVSGVSSMTMNLATILSGTFAGLLAAGQVFAAEATAAPPPPPDVTSNVSAAPAPPAPPPPPYSLPWQLRPVAAATVLRSDTSIAFYENAKGESGESIASTFLASYKLTPEIAPLVRFAIVQNSEPGEGVGKGLGQATAFVNPIIGVTYARKIAGPFRGAAFLGAALPLGMGGDKAPGVSDIARAVGRGIQARSAMDNAMFAVNYTTGIFGLGGAYVANKLTVQLEATVLQLFKTRNDHIKTDDKRTNFTSGLHLGYFLAPVISLGAEYRYQRWLTDADPVRADANARENQTIAIGPRFHFKTGSTWIRPGLSYSTAIDKPFSDANYHMIQVDVPAIF